MTSLAATSAGDHRFSSPAVTTAARAVFATSLRTFGRRHRSTDAFCASVAR